MPDERALAVRAEATRVLRPLADLAAPVAPGCEPPWDQLLRISEHRVARAAECGASLAFDGEFDGWRAAFARRPLSQLVLERMRKGATLDPTSLARDVVAEEARQSRTSLGQWLATLGPGGTAAVVREVAATVIATRTVLTRWPPAPGTRFGDLFHWTVPGRAVRLEASVDAVTRPQGLLLVFARAEGPGAARRELAWPALVATLRAGSVPSSVTRIDLASGERWSVPVTDDVLDDALTAAAVAVEATIAAAYAAPGEPTPGPWCRRCRGVAVCGPGGLWHIARTDHLPHPA